MMDVPSATKLFKYFDEQYGLANLTERTSTRRSNSYVHTIVLKNDEEATYSYSLYGVSHFYHILPNKAARAPKLMFFS